MALIRETIVEALSEERSHNLKGATFDVVIPHSHRLMRLR